MKDLLHSHWTVSQVMGALPGVRRLDHGADLLAFRVAGANPTRAAYVYLYGGDPGLISFDLEDEAVETGVWDHAVRRGGTRSLIDLRHAILDWLGKATAQPAAADSLKASDAKLCRPAAEGIRMEAVPGEASVRQLGTALAERLGAAAFRWIGPPPGPGIDAVGWRLIAAARFLFSVSTHAGSLPDGHYDLQISVIDDTLDNGSIVFLDDVDLAELCAVAERFASGGMLERFG